MATPEQIVERQLEAFNAHDIEAFVQLFADDVVIHDLLDGHTIVRGLDAFRRRYAEVFEKRPRVHAELVGRLEIGAIVIDRERLTDDDGHPPEDALAIYEVRDDVVARMWFIEPEHRRARNKGRSGTDDVPSSTSAWSGEPAAALE